MRTAIIILGGFVLWGACLVAARLLGDWKPSALTTATVVFVAVWFGVAAWNMWMGVAKAGYSVMEELPVFFVIFWIPTAVAVFYRWKVAR